MSAYLTPWNNDLEPNEGNVRHWLDNLYSKFQPVEQSRWNQSNIDTLFYAGNQSFINRHFNFSPSTSQQNYYFNLVQQPVNLVTGYQRQHRKAINYVPGEGADPQTTDQYTRIMTHICNTEGIHEQFSKACELAAISGMCLVQPYLDYSGDDNAQGQLKIKVWEYNSFLIDPYFRNPDMSDANFVWCQEYISKHEAETRFGDKIGKIQPMMGSPQRYGRFYFLPENYNMTRNDLMVLSYVWYKWRTKKKRLYSRSRNQFFDYGGGEDNLDALLYNIPDMEVVTVDVPSWKLAVVLNDQLVFQGDNPLGFTSCPFVPVFWNYDPHVNHFDLRVRSFIRIMRDPQILFNYKVITNNDIAAATINAGWKRKVGAVANEDNLKKAGQGWDVIINDGYEMTDVEKIIPSAVPESDLNLASQMQELIFATSGINMENWAGQEDKQISSLTVLLKQAANLMVFQKYFDQWDVALKILGERLLQVILHNWNAEKVKLILGEEPTEFFYSRVFSKFQVIVEEGLLTPTQKNLQAQQMLEINQAFGREVIPPSMIIKDMNIQGKTEIMEFLKKQEEQMSAVQHEQTVIDQTMHEAELQELYSKAAANIARAREDHSRSESNLGLYEERLSMIERNRAMSLKDKQEAILKLLEGMSKYGPSVATAAQMHMDSEGQDLMIEEEREKADVERRTGANEFLAQILGQGNKLGNGIQDNIQQEQQMSGMDQSMESQMAGMGQNM